MGKRMAYLAGHRPLQPLEGPVRLVSKWLFGGKAAPVTGGTLVQLAQEHGWIAQRRESRALDWDDVINYEKEIVDLNWLEEQEVAQPASEWDPTQELIAYLETLFKPTDFVGYNAKSLKTEDGRFAPASRGIYSKTVVR